VTTPPSTTSRSALATYSALKYNHERGTLKYDGYNGVGSISNTDWIEFDQLNFGTGVSTFSAEVAGPSGHTGSIQVRLDSPTGALVGTLVTKPTGGWGTYKLQSTKISGAKGVHNLYLVFVGKNTLENVESFKFS
jgi:hypothetical protein